MISSNFGFNEILRSHLENEELCPGFTAAEEVPLCQCLKECICKPNKDEKNGSHLASCYLPDRARIVHVPLCLVSQVESYSDNCACMIDKMTDQRGGHGQVSH